MVTDASLEHFMRLAGLEHYARQVKDDSGVTIQLGEADGR